MPTIKILGMGSPDRKKVPHSALRAAKRVCSDVYCVEKTDLNEIMHDNILTTRGPVTNKNLVCVGRIPHIAEGKIWRSQASNKPRRNSTTDQT